MMSTFDVLGVFACGLRGLVGEKGLKVRVVVGVVESKMLVWMEGKN